MRILDVGTGSGCIAVTLAAELPDAEVTGIDVSETVLAVAGRNGSLCGGRVRFECCDILTRQPGGRFDLVVSNPPYVTLGEKAEMRPNVLKHEPHRALFVGDDDPLLFYRVIAERGRSLLAPGRAFRGRSDRAARLARLCGCETDGRPVRKAENNGGRMEVKRTKTPEQALRMLMYRCAKSEVAVSDARRSLVRWGVAEADRQRIVDTLLRERFIDERRYAEAYVREKTGLSRWGVYKIRAALRAKQIPEMLIEEALRQIDPQFMRGKLEEQLRRKMQAIRARNGYELRGKLLRYGVGLGFDFETVGGLVDRLVDNGE